MKISPAALVMAYAFLSFGAATAADQPEPNQAGGTPSVTGPAAPNPAIGFGTGSGIGPGGGVGSASSIGGGFSAPTSGSGGQTFGGGFNQQTAGSGPFASNPALNPSLSPAIGAGGAGGARGAGGAL